MIHFTPTTSQQCMAPLNKTTFLALLGPIMLATTLTAQWKMTAGPMCVLWIGAKRSMLRNVKRIQLIINTCKIIGFKNPHFYLLLLLCTGISLREAIPKCWLPLDAIKERVDPNYIFDCHGCIVNNRIKTEDNDVGGNSDVPPPAETQPTSKPTANPNVDTSSAMAFPAAMHMQNFRLLLLEIVFLCFKYQNDEKIVVYFYYWKSGKSGKGGKHAKNTTHSQSKRGKSVI